MKRAFPISVIAAFGTGLMAQFVWKMIYFPEPLLPVVFELAGIIILAGIAVWCIEGL